MTKTGVTAQGSGSSSTVTQDSWSISEPRSRIHTLPQLVAKFEIDLAEWEVVSFTANAWETTVEGDPQTLYQVKAQLRRRRDVALARKVIADLKADLQKYAPKPVKVRAKSTRRTGQGCMLEIGPLDSHFGRLAWGLETGGDNYDFNIARDLYRKAVETQLSRVAGYDISRVCFVVGHDILHVNGSRLETFNGTSMDFDSRYQRVFRGTRRLLTDIITGIATDVAPVEVVVVPGNHDTDSSFHLGDSLECWFRESKHVQVDNGPCKRKYVEHGAVMLMLTHGEEFTSQAKQRSIPSIMMAEQPAMVGRTAFREAHTGHLHFKQTVDLQGVIARQFSALCSADAWHSKLGFVGSQRSSEALVWSPQDGLVGTAVYSLRNNSQEIA